MESDIGTRQADSGAKQEWPFHLPARLIRQLIGYYICEGSLQPESGALLQTILATVCDLPTFSATIRESRRRRLRSARIIIEVSHAKSFEFLFPEAYRLKNPSPGAAAFRLSGQHLCRE